MTDVLTLGLDGAAWHKLDRLMDEGKLPNLASLVSEGARADLQTVYPPVTCPAWRASTSGKNPGKLGVFWWLNLDRETGSLSAPDARDFDTADVWDYLSEAGHRSAVVNVPMTYPPTELDGVMVSGFGAPFETDIEDSITYPPALAERLREEYDWRIGVEDVSAPGGADEALEIIRSRFELLLDLLDEDEYDYIHLTVFYVNMLQHMFGDGPETERAWRLIDEYLGKLPDDVLKIVYSDHGHSNIDYTFAVNKYLIEEGHLSFSEETTDNLTGYVYRVLTAAGVEPRLVARLAERLLPEAVFDRLASGYPIPMSEVGDRIDWHASDALATSQGPVYLNRDRLGDDYERFRDQLVADLEDLTVDGTSIIDRVYPIDEIYNGPHVDEGPDLMVVPADGWELYGGLTPSIVEQQPTSWTSGNHPIGTLLIHGPDVAATELDRRSILDIAPTVLRYLDCPVPTDIDGTAIEEPFRRLPDSGTRDPLPPTRRSGAGGDELEGRLEDLGYLE